MAVIWTPSGLMTIGTPFEPGYRRISRGGFASAAREEAKRRAAKVRREAERKRIAEEKARREAERKAREEAARKARQAMEEAVRRIREEAIRKRLSAIEREKLVSKELVGIGIARKQEEEFIRKREKERKRKIIAEEKARQEAEIKRASKEEKILVKEAIKEERKSIKEIGQAIRVPKKVEEKVEKIGIPGQTLAAKAIEIEIIKPITAGIKLIGDIEKSEVFQKRAKGLDIITGGAITERRLGREQEELNRGIENFNKKYGGKKLEEAEYKRAIIELRVLKGKENKIKKEGEELEGRTSRKIIKSLSIEGLKKRDLKKFPLTESEKKGIKVIENTLKADKERLKEFEKKPGVLAMIERTRLKVSISNYQDRLNTFKKGGQILATGTVPITPAGGLPKMTNVVFLGTQKTRKGKIITDIVFKTGKRWGTAKGVTITKDTGGVTVTAGKFAKIGKIFKTKKQAFRSIERVVTKKIIRSREEQMILLTRGSKDYLRVRSNLKSLAQIGIGRIQTVKGTKFIRPVMKFPTGKLVPIKAGVSTDTFASLAKIVTKNTWSKIIGKTITTKGDKVTFLGLIKGTTKPGVKFFRLTATQKQQYAAALKQVSSAVAAAVAKADKIEGLTNVQKLAVTAEILSKVAIKKVILPRIKPKVIVKVKPRVIVKPKVIVKVKPRVIVKPKVIVKVKPRVKPKVIARQVFSEKEKIKQKARLKQLSKQESKLKQRLEIKLTPKQKLELKQALKLTKKQIVKTKQILKLTIITPKTLKKAKLTPIPIPKIKKVKKIPKIKKKKPRSYHIYARPLKKKGRKKPKLIRVTKRPIKKGRAKDLRNYLVDTSLSRTGKIKPSPKKPSKRILKSPTSYASKTKKKFRKYKIVKGKRRTLPSGKVIERKRNLLDTKQEKKQITLRKRIAQLQKQAKRKSPKRGIRGMKRKPIKRTLTRRTTRKSIKKSPTRRRISKRKHSISRKMPLKLKKLSRTVIKKAPKGKKPTRYRFKGNQRLGFRNNKVVEIVKFKSGKSQSKKSSRKSITPLQSNYNKRLRKFIKRKATPAQLKALAKGRKILEERRKR